MSTTWSVHKLGGTNVAGAGAEVTAAGVFSDLLGPATFLGAPR